MRTIALSVFLAMAIASAGACCEMSFEVGIPRTPAVVYQRPDNGEKVDLTGKDKLTFSWKMVLLPAGGREAYKFTLYRGDGYDVVVSQTIDPRTFSIDVPADKFEAGTRYRWKVKQRDSRTFDWSRADNWYFTVIKK